MAGLGGAERVEAERVEAERVKAKWVEAERGEAERVEAERVEAKWVEAEPTRTALHAEALTFLSPASNVAAPRWARKRRPPPLEAGRHWW